MIETALAQGHGRDICTRRKGVWLCSCTVYILTIINLLKIFVCYRESIQLYVLIYDPKLSQYST